MGKPEVVVIDYGVGNLLSVKRGLEHCGAAVYLTGDPQKILGAKRVVLPGVGAFSNAMQALESLNLVTVIQELAQRQTPLLGICLGMQLFLDYSEEFGKTAGLALIPGSVIAIPTLSLSDEIHKIPHIGWSELQPSISNTEWQNTLLQNINAGDAAYFVHSFMAVPTELCDRIADCLYGGHKIAAVIGRGHITGCQFHPEKSGEVGLNILKRFCDD